MDWAMRSARSGSVAASVPATWASADAFEYSPGMGWSRGRPGCRCQADPPRPHGPYYQLTRKIAGKTITRRLTGDQAARYAEWIANQRELRRTVAEMQEISRQAGELIMGKDTTTT
jgi:uncharacterized protein YjiS (DUF1127 family)